MTATETLYDSLRKTAPQVSFSVATAIDPNFTWDGDGPDPAEEGYSAHDVDVKAMAIIDGRELEGHSYLGGHYLAYGESDPEISGYLPQMLEEAAKDLDSQIPPDSIIKAQLAAAGQLLKDELRRRYDEQRKIA